MAEFRGRGFRIHYVEQGEGRPVVFAHGALMDHTIFAAQFEDLPDQFRCLAWDMRGHGMSQAPPGPWSIQDMVVDLIAWIEEINAAPCHLVGHSIGGRIALRVALQREDLLRSVTLISTSAERPSDLSAARYTEWSQLAAESGEGPARIAAVARDVFYDRLPAGMAQAHTDRILSMQPSAIAGVLGALVNVPSVAHRLGQVSVPALVVHGESDTVVAITSAEQTARDVPGARFVRVPGGHTPPLEAPDAVNDALSAFLREAG